MKRKICSLLMLLVMLFVIGVPAMAAETLTAKIPVEIVLEGSVLDSEDTFTVQISAENGGPMPAEAELKIKGAGKDVFEIEYSKLGIYSYKIKQIAGDNKDCVYDSSVYTLEVSVTATESGTMEITTALYDANGDKTDSALFKNKYLPVNPAKWDPPVEKKVEVKSGTVPADAEYVFTMIPENKDDPMPENEECEFDSETGALIMKKNTPGSYEFGWMYYGEECIGKTYTYTVKEIPGKDSNFTYDVEIYTMTVKVSVKDRQIVLDVSYADKDGNPIDKMSFTNVYDGEETPPPKTGDTTNLVLYIVLFAAGALALCGVLIFALKRNKKND